MHTDRYHTVAPALEYQDTQEFSRDWCDVRCSEQSKPSAARRCRLLSPRRQIEPQPFKVLLAGTRLVQGSPCQSHRFSFALPRHPISHKQHPPQFLFILHLISPDGFGPSTTLPAMTFRFFVIVLIYVKELELAIEVGDTSSPNTSTRRYSIRRVQEVFYLFPFSPPGVFFFLPRDAC